MTNKYMTGRYPQGYTVENSFTDIFIERKAYIGGDGFRDNFPGTVENFGTIQADNSFSGGSPGVLFVAGRPGQLDTAKHPDAVISGDDGIIVNDFAGFITNFGVVIASYGEGVEFLDGGSLAQIWA